MAERVIVYGADWCGDTVRTKRHLDEKNIAYDYVDIDEDAEVEKKVIEFDKGSVASRSWRSQPTGAPKSLSVLSAMDLEKAIK